MKEKHICIYTTPNTLKHKQGLVEGEGHYYWELSNVPTLIRKAWLDEEDSNREIRVYFAINKQIVGSFAINDFDWDDDMKYCKIEWDTASWQKLEKPISCKPFQGFKYVQGNMR